MLVVDNPWKGHLEYMEFTAGLGAQEARLTFSGSEQGARLTSSEARLNDSPEERLPSSDSFSLDSFFLNFVWISNPGDNGENRQPDGKKYNGSGNHGENEAFAQCLKRGRPAHFTYLILLYQLYVLSLP